MVAPISPASNHGKRLRTIRGTESVARASSATPPNFKMSSAASSAHDAAQHLRRDLADQPPVLIDHRDALEPRGPRWRARPLLDRCWRRRSETPPSGDPDSGVSGAGQQQRPWLKRADGAVAVVDDEDRVHRADDVRGALDRRDRLGRGLVWLECATRRRCMISPALSLSKASDCWMRSKVFKSGPRRSWTSSGRD